MLKHLKLVGAEHRLSLPVGGWQGSPGGITPARTEHRLIGIQYWKSTMTGRPQVEPRDRGTLCSKTCNHYGSKPADTILQSSWAVEIEDDMCESSILC